MGEIGRQSLSAETLGVGAANEPGPACTACLRAQMPPQRVKRTGEAKRHAAPFHGNPARPCRVAGEHRLHPGRGGIGAEGTYRHVEMQCGFAPSTRRLRR